MSNDTYKKKSQFQVQSSTHTQQQVSIFFVLDSYLDEYPRGHVAFSKNPCHKSLNILFKPIINIYILISPKKK